MTDFKKLKVWQKANSTTELEYHLLAARDLADLPASDSVTLIAEVVEVRKMIYGLLRYLASRSEATAKNADARRV